VLVLVLVDVVLVLDVVSLDEPTSTNGCALGFKP
jgi:hypothetical protein